MSQDCSDKIEINVSLQIKVDPKTGMWYLKHVKLAHEETKH